MPTITEVLAFDWSVDSDLEAAGVFASGFRARYSQPLASNQQWDNGIFGGLTIYRGEAAPNLVRIRGTFDGITDIIVTGVVDRNGIVERDGVVGELSGRDLLALALDRYPTPVTFTAGLNVQDAVSELASQAGFPLVWSGETYGLGRDIAVTADRTIAEWIEDFLVPLRWADRHRFDVWTDEVNLYVADRMNFYRGDVTVPYSRVTLERMEETALPSAEVYVEGASYEDLEAIPDVPITSVTTVDTSDVSEGSTRVIITTTTTEWFDSLSRLYRRDKYVQTQTFVSSILRRTVLETTLMLAVFLDGLAYPVSVRGKRSSENETSTKTRADGLTGSYKTSTREWTYDSEGEQASQKSTEFSYDVESGVLAEHQATKYHFSRGGGQVTRHWDVQQTDPETGEVKRRTGQGEIGAGSLPSASLTPVPPGFQRVTRRYHSAGSPSARRRESSDMLGSDANCNVIAVLISEDYLYRKIRVTLSFLPNLEVRPGRRLIVTGAPAYWKASEFYVISSSASKAGNGSDQRIEGVAWVAI